MASRRTRRVASFRSILPERHRRLERAEVGIEPQRLDPLLVFIVFVGAADGVLDERHRPSPRLETPSCRPPAGKRGRRHQGRSRTCFALKLLHFLDGLVELLVALGSELLPLSLESVGPRSHLGHLWIMGERGGLIEQLVGLTEMAAPKLVIRFGLELLDCRDFLLGRGGSERMGARKRNNAGGRCRNKRRSQSPAAQDTFHMHDPCRVDGGGAGLALTMRPLQSYVPLMQGFAPAADNPGHDSRCLPLTGQTHGPARTTYISMERSSLWTFADESAL